MASITIRKLDVGVKVKLRIRAAEHAIPWKRKLGEFLKRLYVSLRRMKPSRRAYTPR